MQNLKFLTELKRSQNTEVVQKSGNLHLASGTSTTSIVFADFMTSYWLRTLPLWYPYRFYSLHWAAFCININVLYLQRQPAVKNTFPSKLYFDFLWLHPILHKLSRLQNSTGIFIFYTFIDIFTYLIIRIKEKYDFKVFLYTKNKKCFRRYCLAKELCNNTLGCWGKTWLQIEFSGVFFLFIVPNSKEPSNFLITTHVSWLTLFTCRFSEFESNLTIPNIFWHLHLT